MQWNNLNLLGLDYLERMRLGQASISGISSQPVAIVKSRPVKTSLRLIHPAPQYVRTKDTDAGHNIPAKTRVIDTVYLEEVEDAMGCLSKPPLSSECRQEPKAPEDPNLDETVLSLKGIFCEQSLLFSLHYNCLKLTKCSDGDYVTDTGCVNRWCRRFSLQKMTEDQLKCPVIV
ncbi:unnamed protein product [Taenia asiatica]|uniref:HTH_48 domain-containing protein n=1 Tax=Taenia asiatica TaxID=60517 RepID=A0A0R3VVX1_TAEAS|nr:unnamed protein product [Taenia asiatica]